MTSFWGVILENGKRYTQTVDAHYHLTKAALDVTSEKKSKSPIAVLVEHNKTEYLLCTLNGETRPQESLDLMFAEGEEVSFFVNGDGTVHLTGYSMPDEDEFDDFEDEDFSEPEELDTPPKLGAKRKQAEVLKLDGKKLKTDEGAAVLNGSKIVDVEVAKDVKKADKKQPAKPTNGASKLDSSKSEEDDEDMDEESIDEDDVDSVELSKLMEEDSFDEDDLEDEDLGDEDDDESDETPDEDLQKTQAEKLDKKLGGKQQQQQQEKPKHVQNQQKGGNNFNKNFQKGQNQNQNQKGGKFNKNQSPQNQKSGGFQQNRQGTPFNKNKNNNNNNNNGQSNQFSNKKKPGTPFNKQGGGRNTPGSQKASKFQKRH